MDFKEDQLAIEAHVRMRCGYRDMDEISEEEYLEYAYEYIYDHPFESWFVCNGREAIVYDRIDGEFVAMRTLPGIPFFWLQGCFWYSVGHYVRCFGRRRRESLYKIRLFAEYLGLID